MRDNENEIFFLHVERSNPDGRSHDGTVVKEIEKQINKERLGHIPAKQAKKTMLDAGIAAEHVAGTRALEDYRHRYLQNNKSYDGKFVETFWEFCQNPPVPVTIMQLEHAPVVSKDVVRVLFYEQENVSAALDYLKGVERCVLIMDATFCVNVQDLVLAGFGLCVLHVVNGVVRNRFWPAVCAVSHREDEECYTLMCKAFQNLLQEAGLDWQKLVRNVVMDGAGGAITPRATASPKQLHTVISST